jgi:hypothetical protein
VADREKIDSRSLLVESETGDYQVDQWRGDKNMARLQLGLSGHDRVSVLTRCRQLKKTDEREWKMVAIEQSCFSSSLTPGLLNTAVQQIKENGDTAIYRLLRRIYPNDELFKAHYEISLDPLPAPLAANWSGTTDRLIAVLTVTYCSKGAVEMTRTWFDASKAALTAGTLDVKLI